VRFDVYRNWAAHTLFASSPPMPKRMVRAFRYNRCRNKPANSDYFSYDIFSLPSFFVFAQF